MMRLSRSVAWVAPLIYMPLVLRSVSTKRPPSNVTAQWVLDRLRSGSGSTQSLPGPRPIDRLPAARVRRLSLSGTDDAPPVRVRIRRTASPAGPAPAKRFPGVFQGGAFQD